MSNKLTDVQTLKLELLSRGVAVDESAYAAHTGGGMAPLTVADYPTTGGLTLVLPDGNFVNAPLHESVSSAPAGVVRYDPESSGFLLEANGRAHEVTLLHQPGYLSEYGDEVVAVMTHADRARLMPIDGCPSRCAFCDTPLHDYVLRPKVQLLRALNIALADTRLPARHVLISGGTPRERDQGYLDDVYRTVIGTCPQPVDVMLTPRQDGDIIDRLVEWGVEGLAINLELWDEDMAARLTPYKWGIGKREFATSIRRAVELTGGQGRVRSLLLVGLEQLEDTLLGVEFLAELGCDPCLSPFRPAAGTPPAASPPPDPGLLTEAYFGAKEITDRCGVRLGPRCVPCQHNTVAFCDDGDKRDVRPRTPS